MAMPISEDMFQSGGQQVSQQKVRAQRSPILGMVLLLHIVQQVLWQLDGGYQALHGNEIKRVSRHRDIVCFTLITLSHCRLLQPWFFTADKCCIISKHWSGASLSNWRVRTSTCDLTSTRREKVSNTINYSAAKRVSCDQIERRNRVIDNNFLVTLSPLVVTGMLLTTSRKTTVFLNRCAFHRTNLSNSNSGWDPSCQFSFLNMSSGTLCLI